MAEPILRWAGGKRQYLDRILSYIPPEDDYNTYFEPFFGGGSVYFALEPNDAHINDINPRLMNFYTQIQISPSEIISKNKELDSQFHPIISSEQKKLRDFTDSGNVEAKKTRPSNANSSKDPQTIFYEEKREEFNNLRELEGDCEAPTLEAALFLFLNRTCWNGLYRTNKSGEFNVPMGRQWTKTVFLEDRIRKAHRVLDGTTITSVDFSEVVAKVGKNDLVFLDPPYPAGPKKDSFQSYHHTEFNLERQKELAKCILELDSMGTHVLITNKPSNDVLEIYEDIGIFDKFDMDKLEGSRMINSIIDERTDIGETDIILTNCPSLGRKDILDLD